jgi:hypothetical protein
MPKQADPAKPAPTLVPFFFVDPEALLTSRRHREKREALVPKLRAKAALGAEAEPEPEAEAAKARARRSKDLIGAA